MKMRMLHKILVVLSLAKALTSYELQIGDIHIDMSDQPTRSFPKTFTFRMKRHKLPSDPTLFSHLISK